MGASQTSIEFLNQNQILLNPRWPKQEYEQLREVAEEVTQRRSLQGHVWIATSGSTASSVGQTKLVALSREALLASAHSVNFHLQAKVQDKWLQVLPRFHVGGLGVEIRAALSGSQVFSDFEKWDFRRVYKTLDSENITLLSLVPTQVFDFVQANLLAPQSLRAIVVGGGALTESLYKRARALGWPLLPSYGMTETCSQIATASLESLQQAEMPLAQKLSHAEWRLSSKGNLEVSAKSLFTCYAQRNSDQKIVDWDPKVDGWFGTEDFVELKGNGLRVLGRQNDFVKIGGEGTSLGRLREIFERILIEKNVSETKAYALLNIFSERLENEIILATTHHDKDPELGLVVDGFNQEVLPFERIRNIKYVSTIPRTDLGKVLWGELKKFII